MKRRWGWFWRLVHLPGTVDDGRAWCGWLITLASSLPLVWGWVVGKALGWVLSVVPWITLVLSVFFLLAIWWNTHRARKGMATASGLSKTRIEEWLAFIDGYRLEWVDMGRDAHVKLSLTVGTFRTNICFEPLWAQMRPFLSDNVVGDVERAVPSLSPVTFVKAEHLKMLIRRDLGVLLRDGTVGSS